MRVLLATQSHIAFKDAVDAGEFSLFIQKMEPLVQQYQALYKPSGWMQTLKQVKQLAMRLLGR